MPNIGQQNRMPVLPIKTPLFCLCFFFCLNYVSAQTYSSLHRIDALHYTFEIEVSDQHDKITGHCSILFKVKQNALDTLILDLIAHDKSGMGMLVKEVMLNENTIRFTQKKEHLLIFPEAPLEKNYSGSIQVSYQGEPEDGLVISENEYGDRTFFGDNWPNRARYWLPVIDHPSDKATCEFKITAPAHYKVIANGLLREESFLGKLSGESKKLTHWVSSQPIPTKVMVFGAANFAVLYEKPVLNIPIQQWVYADDRESSFGDFEHTANILHYFSQFIGDYPYEKLANVESKTKFGGMENASNIFYNELVVDGNNSIEALMAHEIAHQWFGNAVSEKSWEHIWLSEGFSTYLSHMYMEHTYGSDTLISLLKDDKNRVFSYYRKSPTSPVVDTTEENIFRYLNANSYQKGSWFLHMLRQKVGDQSFQKGVKLFYKQECHGSAETKDFKLVMEKVYGQSLDSFFEQWLYHPGHPIVEGSWKFSGLGKKLKIELEQVQENGQMYHLPLEIGVYYGENDEPEIHQITFNQKEQSYSLKLNAQPKAVALDPNEKILMETHFVSK